MESGSIFPARRQQVSKMAQDATGRWKDYLFLTREMLLFLEKQNMDMFYSLLEQRERMQAMIQDRGEYEYLFSPDGRLMAAEIQCADDRMRMLLRGEQSKMTQQRQARFAYKNAVAGPVGLRANHLG